MGYKSTSVYYDRNQRVAGESHYPFAKMVNLALNGITSLSVKPLRYITTIGIVMAIISFFVIIWALVARFAGNTVAGWTSMVGIMALIGGIQLFCLGIIGQYVSKIYTEAKGRPLYVIKDEINSDSVK